MGLIQYGAMVNVEFDMNFSNEWWRSTNQNVLCLHVPCFFLDFWLFIKCREMFLLLLSAKSSI